MVKHTGTPATIFLAQHGDRKVSTKELARVLSPVLVEVGREE